MQLRFPETTHTIGIAPCLIQLLYWRWKIVPETEVNILLTMLNDRVIERNYSSALILEDDADWDVAIRPPQLPTPSETSLTASSGLGV